MTVKPILHLGQRLSRFAQARIQRYTHLLSGDSKQQTTRTPEVPDLIWRMPEAGAAAYAPEDAYDEYADYQDDVISENDEPGVPRPVPADLAAIISGHAAKREAEGSAPPTSSFDRMQSIAPAHETPIRRAPDVGTSNGMSAPPQPRAAAPIRRAPDVGTSNGMSAPAQPSASSQPSADLPKPRRSRESLIAALTGAPVEPPMQPSASDEPPYDDDLPQVQAAFDNDLPQVQAAFDDDLPLAQSEFDAAPLSVPSAESEPTPTVAQLMRERAPQRRPSAPPPNIPNNESPVRTPFRASRHEIASPEIASEDTAEAAWTGQVPPVQAMPAPDVRTPSAETPLLRKSELQSSHDVRAPFMASNNEASAASLDAPAPDYAAPQDEMSEDSAPMMDLFNALLASGFTVDAADDVPGAPPVQTRTVASDAPIIARKPQSETPPAMPSDQLTNSGIEAAVSTRQFKRLTAQLAQPGVGDVPADVASSLISSNESQPDMTAGEEWTGQVPSVQTMPVQRMPAPSDVRTPLMASNDSTTEINHAEVQPTAPVIDSSLFELLGLPPDTPVQGAEIFAQRQPAPSTPDVRTPFMASNPANPSVENTPPHDIRSMNQPTLQRDANVGTPNGASAPSPSAPSSSAPSSSTSASSSAAPPADADAEGAEGGDVNVDQLARDVLNVLRDRLRIESERRSGRG